MNTCEVVVAEFVFGPVFCKNEAKHLVIDDEGVEHHVCNEHWEQVKR